MPNRLCQGQKLWGRAIVSFGHSLNMRLEVIPSVVSEEVTMALVVTAEGINPQYFHIIHHLESEMLPMM